jgi:hypothetical protein
VAAVRVVGAVVLVAIMLSATVLGPFGLSAYVGGLLNFSPLGVVMGTLVGWLGLFIIGIRRLLRVQRIRSGKAGRGIVFWAVVVGGIVASSVLQIAGAPPSAAELYLRGFRTYVESRTDIDAIQAWVKSLDPADYADERPEHFRRELDPADQPPAIARLHATVWLELDEAGRPKVRLIWDASKFGLWGLVVGDENMGTPESDPSIYGDLCHELEPGVYFWFREG